MTSASHHDLSPEARELIRSMTTVPLLRPDEEHTLAQTVRATTKRLAEIDALLAKKPTEALREERGWVQEQHDVAYYHLFSANIGLVLKCANKSHRLDFEDTFQWAIIGLIRAIKKFDPNRVNKETGEAIRFSTYAIWWIRQFIQRGSDQDDSLIRLPVTARDKNKKMTKGQLAFIQQHKRIPDFEELIHFIDEDIEKSKQLIYVTQAPLSLNAPHYDDNTESTLESSDIGHAPSIEENFLEQEEKQHVQNTVVEALNALEAWRDPETGIGLDKRCVAVLRLRFRIGEEADMSVPATRTLREVGLLLIDTRNPKGITRERARQLQREAVGWLRVHRPALMSMMSGKE